MASQPASPEQLSSRVGSKAPSSHTSRTLTHAMSNPHPSLAPPTPLPPRPMSGRAVMVHPDPAIRSWQRLEALRLRSIGLKSLPKSFMVARTYAYEPIRSTANNRLPALTRGGGSMPRIFCQSAPFGFDKTGNAVAPFKTLGKPTCGYFFSFETDHKKIKHGLPPTDLPKWRYLTS